MTSTTGLPGGPGLTAGSLQLHHLAHAFEDAVIGMTLVAPDNTPLIVNTAFCEFLGYTRPQLLATRQADIVHPDDLPRHLAYRAMLLAGERATYRLEKRYIHRDGRVLWADFSCKLVRDEAGRPLHFLSQVQDITQRKQAELALQDSEERFRNLCALSSDWYWEQDAELRFTRFETNLRTPPWLIERMQSVLGKRRWELPDVTPAHGTWDDHREVLRARQPFFDFEYVDAIHGRCSSISGEPVYEDGRFVGYRGTARDTSARRLMERELREAHAVMDIAGQIGQLGGWAYENGQPALTLSAQVCAIVGAKPGYAPTPEEAMKRFAEESRPLIREVLGKCLKDGSPFDIEVRALTQKGQRVWLRVLCEAEWGDDGQVKRLHGALQDISAGKRAQLALQESERQLAALMSNLPGQAYRCRNAPDWPLSFVSQGALALTGYTPDRLIAGEPAYGDLIHPGDRGMVWDEVQRALGERRQFQLTYRLRTAGGEEKWAWEQGCGVYDADGSLRSIEGFVADVTRQKLAELEVARLNESLEERVRQRTEQMQQAIEELEALAYSIAHDLRAPMTSLHGFSRLLAQNLGSLPPPNDHYLSRIMTNVRHMSDLTDALLSLARLSGVRLTAEPVDLAVLARQALQQLQEGDPACPVAAGIPGALPAVGDPGLLQRVVSNLVGNAWKFSRPKGEVRIRVGVETLAGGERAFFVQDSGVGFDMAHAGNLFGAFRRLHSDGGFDGTGIGLALVRKIITRHGGRVWAQAQPGEGATFYFTLPAR
jgi:PAS domain S-box-containing protein